tara:strand:+ start:26607 stop:27914 length:1308 start_codon:yes stop_codon:yes gene_type:complete
MANNLWSLKFGKDNTIPVLIRAGTNTNSANLNLQNNEVYSKLNGGDTPYIPIDVREDFQWTKSPKSSRLDVPSLSLKEKRIIKNSTVTNLAYSVNATADLAKTLSDKISQGDFIFFNEDAIKEGSILESTTNLVKGGASTISDTLEATQSLINEKLLGTQTFKSSVLQPYNGLYSIESTGFQYILPFLNSEYRSMTTAMGEDQENIISNIAGAAADAASQVAGTVFALRPGVYIEESRQFQMSQDGRSVNIVLPLLNTGSYEDILQNWQLIFGLTYQNRPGRITKNLVDIPVIYEAIVEDILFMPYAYISELSVNFLGNRRTMEITVPVEGSDSSNNLTLNATIPDAYELNLTLKGLNEETRNFIYESINPGVVRASETGGDVTPSEAPIPDDSNTKAGPTNFSSRSNPGRRSVRNKPTDPTPRPKPKKIKRRNN